MPATDINREGNNPAKAAIKAKQALKKDEAATENAKQESQAADAAVAQPAGISDDMQLVRIIEAALRNDARTQKLGVSVRLDEGKQIGLHGSVPSPESRAVVIDVATKLAGPARVKSHLVVTRR